MKDSEFIELLNLYLDHEISAADAARLEAEVLTNAARRPVYQGYCRMQKACRLVGENFVTEAVPAPAGNVVAFESALAPRRTGFYAAGVVVAAAACLAVVLVNRRAELRVAPAGPPTVAVQPSPASAAAHPAALASSTASTERTLGHAMNILTHDTATPALVSTLSLADKAKEASADPLFVASEQTAAAQFDWMRTLQLAPLQRVSIENLKFDTQPTLHPDTRTYGSGSLLNGASESNALRFQRGR